MPDKRCPHCGLWNTEAALVCDCGFDFQTLRLRKPPTPTGPPVAAAWRIGLIALGAATIPAFGVGVILFQTLERSTLSSALVKLLPLVLPPLYWLLYFTRRAKLWARVFMLLAGIVSVAVAAFVAASVLMRILTP